MATIANNDDYVADLIRTGQLPADQRETELLRLERLQHAATRKQLVEACAELDALRKAIEG